MLGATSIQSVTKIYKSIITKIYRMYYMNLKKHAHEFMDLLDKSTVNGTIEYSNYDTVQTLVFTHKDNKYPQDIYHVIVGTDNGKDYQKHAINQIKEILTGESKVILND